MMVHPEIQQKIQAELDTVIGQGRFPRASDRPLLPYADAAWKESERWIVPVPLGTVRMNNQDDIYEGMRIPNNSKIFPNVRFVRFFVQVNEIQLTFVLVLCLVTQKYSINPNDIYLKGGSSHITLKLKVCRMCISFSDLGCGMSCVEDLKMQTDARSSNSYDAAEGFVPAYISRNELVSHLACLSLQHTVSYQLKVKTCLVLQNRCMKSRP
jgi:hypothetical protein